MENLLSMTDAKGEVQNILDIASKLKSISFSSAYNTSPEKKLIAEFSQNGSPILSVFSLIKEKPKFSIAS